MKLPESTPAASCITDFPPGDVSPQKLMFFPFVYRSDFPDASGTAGMAYRYRGRGSLPESVDGFHGAAACGGPFLRRKYAARKSGSLAVDPPGKLPVPGYRSPASSGAQQ